MNKLFFVKLMICLLFVQRCSVNSGIDSSDLVTQSEAERRLGLAIFIKLSEKFPTQGVPFPYQLSQDNKCKRDSFYKQNSVKECEVIILASNINSSDYFDYNGKLIVLVEEVWKLEKQIFLDNSLSGEINFCGFQGNNNN